MKALLLIASLLPLSAGAGEFTDLLMAPGLFAHAPDGPVLAYVLDREVPEGGPLATQLNRVPLLRRLVGDAGFSGVTTSWRNYQNEVDSAEEFWDLHRTIRSDSRKRLLVARPGAEDEVKREFMDACRRTIERGGVMAFPISVVFLTAQKPGAGA